MDHELFHDYYYYDMSDLDNQKTIVSYDDLAKNAGIHDTNLYNAYGFAKKTSPEAVPDKTSYVQTNHFVNFLQPEDQSHRPSWITSGFVISSFTDELKKNIVVPATIEGYPVFGVGYRAFESASMESIRFKSESILVLPFALNHCPNLKSVSFASRWTVLFSMAVANCPVLETIDQINFMMDASLYNLPKLNKITNYSYDVVFASKQIEHTGIRANYAIEANHGTRKSAFYLCPNIQEITMEKTLYNVPYKIEEDDDILYLRRIDKNPSEFQVPLYLKTKKESENQTWIIKHSLYLRRPDKFMNGLFDAESKKCIFPYMNDGYQRNVLFDRDTLNSQFEIVGDKIYCSPTYPEALNPEYKNRVRLEYGTIS